MVRLEELITTKRTLDPLLAVVTAPAGSVAVTATSGAGAGAGLGLGGGGMSELIDNGGPAFPHPDYLAAGWEGMSLLDYFAAKARLFTPDRARMALVNVDDEHGRRLVATATVPTRTMSAHGREADWSAVDVESTASAESVGTRRPDSIKDT